MSAPSHVTLRCGIHHADEVAEYVRGLGGRRLGLRLASPTAIIDFETDRPEAVLTAGLLAVYGVDIEVAPAPPDAEVAAGADPAAAGDEPVAASCA